MTGRGNEYGGLREPTHRYVWYLSHPRDLWPPQTRNPKNASQESVDLCKRNGVSWTLRNKSADVGTDPLVKPTSRLHKRQCSSLDKPLVCGLVFLPLWAALVQCVTRGTGPVLSQVWRPRFGPMRRAPPVGDSDPLREAVRRQAQRLRWIVPSSHLLHGRRWRIVDCLQGLALCAVATINAQCSCLAVSGGQAVQPTLWPWTADAEAVQTVQRELGTFCLVVLGLVLCFVRLGAVTYSMTTVLASGCLLLTCLLWFLAVQWTTFVLCTPRSLGTQLAMDLLLLPYALYLGAILAYYVWVGRRFVELRAVNLVNRRLRASGHQGSAAPGRTAGRWPRGAVATERHRHARGPVGPVGQEVRGGPRDMESLEPMVHLSVPPLPMALSLALVVPAPALRYTSERGHPGNVAGQRRTSVAQIREPVQPCPPLRPVPEFSPLTWPLSSTADMRLVDPLAQGMPVNRQALYAWVAAASPAGVEAPPTASARSVAH